MKGWETVGPMVFAVVHVRDDGSASVTSIFTHDSVRRRGLATRLIEAIGERYSRLTGVSLPAARGFYEKLAERGLGRIDEQGRCVFIPKNERKLARASA